MLKRLTLSLLVAAGLWGVPATPSLAQQTGEADIFAPVADTAVDPTIAPGQQPAQKPAKKVKLAAQSQKPVRADAAPAAGSDVDQRLQVLEEQIADMQVAVATMESMGKSRNNTATAAAGTAGGEADVRVGRLEAQMQGLNAQMSDLANQMRALELRLQSGAAAPLKTQPVLPRQVGAVVATPGKHGALTSALGEQPAAADIGFGQTTVSQGALGDQGMAAADGTGVAENVTLDPPAPPATARIRPLPPLAAQPLADASAQVASLAPPANDPQAAYDQAYGFILQQDYNGAEAAFRDYIGRFPQSPLASNAHYWLGQSFYARGLYKPAADAFLRGYKSYRTGQKAPDSLLKVAMSLSRLGQKDMACSALTALDGEFPNAPAQVKHLAQTERDRTGC